MKNEKTYLDIGPNLLRSRGRPVEFLDASPRAEDLADYDTKKFG